MIEQETVYVNTDNSIYTNDYYSSLFSNLGARVIHQISISRNTSYASLGANSGSGNSGVLSDNSNATANDSSKGQITILHNNNNYYYVDFGGKYEYYQSNGTLEHPKDSGQSFSLGNLFNITITKDNKKSGNVTSDVTVAIGHISQHTRNIGIYIENPGLQYNNSRHDYFYNLIPYVSFYTYTSSGRSSSPVSLTSNSGNGTLVRLAKNNTSSIGANTINYSSNLLANVTLQSSGSSTYGSAGKYTYVLTSVYGNYFEFTRGDKNSIATKADRNILISLESSDSGYPNVTNSSSQTLKDFFQNPNPSTITIDGKSNQKYTLKGYLKDGNSSIIFTYAPFVTLNFNEIKDAKSVQGADDNVKGIKSTSISAKLNGSTFAPARTNGPKEITYGLASTSSGVNLIVTVTMTIDEGFEFSKLEFGNYRLFDSGTNLKTTKAP